MASALIVFLAAFCFGEIPQTSNFSGQAKRVLILFEGSDVPSNLGRGDARELGMLLGHFNAEYTMKGVDAYIAGEINKYDIAFFIGYSKRYDPPERFLRDVYAAQKQIVWMNTGFDRFSALFDLQKRFGISFAAFDTASHFDIVKARNQTFTKGEPNLNIISISRDGRVEILATAYSSSKQRESPYIVRSGNFMYIADSPFASATETDRYVLFADMLHEILGENHEELHRALLRIEDVDLFENPNRLRDIADALSAKHIPFLVGIIPFFVDPSAGIRLSLSDKPEFVDAIHYMAAHGATIVLHGITHQYQGVTGTDYEFWDESLGRTIKNDSKDYVDKKMSMGLDECWKNNIYPLIWETPHYAASQLDYRVFSSFFSTAMEQRLVIDNLDYSQYFPYIIERDLYGQRILPENLGYIPFSDDPKVEEAAVQHLVKGAEVQLSVRDGFASAFIHPFIDITYIEQYVDKILDLGYTFMDVKNGPCAVRLKDRVILTGEGSYTLTLEDQYLREMWLGEDGQMDHREISHDRIHGVFKKSVQVPAGQIYLAEPSEYREAELTFFEKLQHKATTFWTDLFQREETFDEARVALLWDPRALGSALNDQASFEAAFRSLNIQVDTLVGDSVGELTAYNLLIVPYHTVDHLSNSDYDRIVQFVENGGNLITDGKNGVAEELGIQFAGSSIKIERMRDRLYPEDALTVVRSEIMARYEVGRTDEVFCIDERTEAPVVIGRRHGEGKFLYFGLRFDPVSTGGYSRFPYLVEYVRSFFRLRPILRRENLEVYFDPGFRHNISVEDLAKRWVTAGIRIIHAAGWHQYPTWTYDYARLIELCHDNGILVYGWLEPPQVSQKFWNEHLQWRELNYKGEPIRPSWRYPVALTDPECLKTVKAIYKEFLQAYNWDGINLAELYFDSDNGPQNPPLLTPMHRSAREEFKRKAGFDPALLVDSLSGYYWKRNPAAWKRFEEYRVETVVRLHAEFLAMIEEVRSEKPYLDVIVTALDNIGNPELRTNNGVDINRIIALRKRYPFTLQVEDPQSEWSKDPRRYRKLAEKYRALLGIDSKVMVDLNILQFRTENVPTPFPTLIQTGIESYNLIHSAAMGSDRFSIYGESSIRPQDLRMMAYASSAQASIQRIDGGWRIQAPFPVVLELPKEYGALQTLQGERIFSDGGMCYVPPGEHTLRAEKLTASPFLAPPIVGLLLSVSGELTSLTSSTRSVTFSYRSATRCIASFNHPPYTIILDGKEINAEVLKGYRRFSVVLPHGAHTVIAVLETTVSYGVDITSFWSSWLIVAFGIISGAALFAFYTLVRISRTSESTP